MNTWCFINSTKQFRMSDWLSENNFVEYLQKNKVKVGEIVYLYTTAPICRIEYKMTVERINIPLEESVDDWDYSLLSKRPIRVKNDKFVRLRLLEKVENQGLSLDELRKHGLTASMQSNFIVRPQLLEYIEMFFTS